MALLGKVLPTQVSGDPENPLQILGRIRLVGPDAASGEPSIRAGDGGHGHAQRFDKVAYQRDYMRKRRAKLKASK